MLRDILSLTFVAGLIAYFSPSPWWSTDRDVYERMAREWVVPSCNDFHCFRPFVSWILGRIPGPPLLIWKSYAVLCQVGAGLAMSHWVQRWGASASTGRMIAWLTALGSGACYTFFDPHTSDPLMHLLGPLLMLLIDHERVVTATVIALAGVMAKEFAAAPLVIAATYRALRHEWVQARSLAIGAGLVFGSWALWQTMARTILGYITGPTYSADLTRGGFIVFWLELIPPLLAAMLVAAVFGGLWLLWAAGLVRGPSRLRSLTFAAIPVILIFTALQQPERALWNFAFIAMPAVAVVLNQVPARFGWLLVAAQVLLNARSGGQLPMVPPSRLTLLLSVAIAIGMIAASARRSGASSSRSTC